MGEPYHCSNPQDWTIQLRLCEVLLRIVGDLRDAPQRSLVHGWGIQRSEPNFDHPNFSLNTTYQMKNSQSKMTHEKVTVYILETGLN